MNNSNAVQNVVAIPDLTQALFGRAILVLNKVGPSIQTGEMMYLCEDIYSGKTASIPESKLVNRTIINTHRRNSEGYQARIANDKRLAKQAGVDVKDLPNYKAWQNMLDRCHGYANGKFAVNQENGIQVCREWMRSFWAFDNYMGDKPNKDSVIIRDQLNVGYQPGNVYWGTVSDRIRKSTLGKLTDHEAKRIRTLDNQGYDVEQIIEILGIQHVAEPTVESVITRNTFKHLP